MILSSVDPILGLTTHTATGSVTAEELCDTATKFVRDAPTRLAFWDFTVADFSSLPTSALASVFNAVRPFAENRRGGKTALLFNSDLGFGLGRMSEALAESREYPFQFRSFWDREAAMNWLFAEHVKVEEDTGAA